MDHHSKLSELAGQPDGLDHVAIGSILITTEVGLEIEWRNTVVAAVIE